MLYPFILFFRDPKYAEITDTFINQNKKQLVCSIWIHDANDRDKWNLVNDVNNHIFITFGDSFDEYESVARTVIDQNTINTRHIHINSNDPLNVDEFNNVVNVFYTKICATPRELVRPTFSMFTTSYNSYDKIFRVYNSLLNQTMKSWEWVILDDSPSPEHFDWLVYQFDSDPRIRLYKRSKNNGSIGNVKNESIGLCRGKYVLEMDHDDELMPWALEDATNAFESDPEIGFLYMDFICAYENGANHTYGDFTAKGYAGYYGQKIDGKWRLVYSTACINNVTLSHLVCLPNHPRMWRRDTLFKLGSYCEYLPICDDYEIILRSAIGTKCAKIAKVAYCQYMNQGNNNFSLIRNSEINRIGPKFISPIYFEDMKINEKMKELNAYEDERYMIHHSKIWKRKTDFDGNEYKNKFCNKLINTDYDKQYCIIGYDTLLRNLDNIRELYKNERNDFILLDGHSQTEYLWSRLDELGLDRMKCYSLIGETDEELKNYFHLIYSSLPDKEVFENVIKRPAYNTNFKTRACIINSITRPEHKYLEIGIEYGQTFLTTHFNTKVGVDPDPKFTDDKLKSSWSVNKLTSDDFFHSQFKSDNDVSSENKYDAIFIDGMHQSDYFLRDLNNSIRLLNNGGTILVDDVLPLNYNEQLRVPKKHYYENGILKYGEEWTGDIWKVIYYLLKNYNDKIESFQYFYNPNFRGIAAFKIKEAFQIEVPNEDDKFDFVDYFNDFNTYCNLLQEGMNKE